MELPQHVCRDDVTRTRDPYVPNVVRYQLRYISIFLQNYIKITDNAYNIVHPTKRLDIRLNHRKFPYSNEPYAEPYLFELC